MDKYYWIFNIDRCIGCESCIVACKQENETITGVHYRHLHIINPEHYPQHPTYRISLSCNHCAEPACLKGCPVKAYEQKDGIVIHDQKKCVGCRYCLWLCPYDAPQFSEVKGKVEKCNLCKDRLNRGLQPACVEACPTGALRLVKSCDDINEDDIIINDLSGIPENTTSAKIRFMGKRRLKAVNKGEESS